jgi:integrase
MAQPAIRQGRKPVSKLPKGIYRRSIIGRDGKLAIVYQVKVRLQGFPPASATFERVTDAQRWQHDTIAAIRARKFFQHGEAEKHTLADAIDRYIRDELPTKPRSAPEYRNHLTWWKAEIGKLRLADVTPPVLAEARDKLEKGLTRFDRPRSASTVTYYLRTLSHLFTVATREWQWTEENPLRKVRLPRLPPGRVRFLSDDERKALLAACKNSINPLLHPVVVLALSTGMRKGEILSLAWKDVDLARSWLVLHDTKNSERRGLPITVLALEVMKGLNKVRRIDTPLVFAGQTGKPVELDKAWRAALRAAEVLDFRFHDLRHSAASYLAMNGATPGEIAAVLGHKTLQMVKRYAHLSDAHTAEVVRRMNERIFENTTRSAESS